MGVVFYQYRAGTEWQGYESAPLWFLLKCHTRLTGWTIFKWFTNNYGRNATTITLYLTTSSSLQPSSPGGLIPLYPQVTRHYLPNTDLGNVQRCAVSPPPGPGRSVWVGIRTHLSGCGTDSGAPVHWFLVRACSVISSAERVPPWFLSSFEPVYHIPLTATGRRPFSPGDTWLEEDTRRGNSIGWCFFSKKYIFLN